MTRDVARLASRTFDVLIVGGGIYGLTIAYDAAQRGLAVALVERDDFGSGASFNHLRTIHGGLRYLQRLDFRRARESVLERRTLARIAPQTIAPVPFVLPLSWSLTRGKTAMRIGFFLDRLVAIDRNGSTPASHRLPAGRVISRREAAQHFPGLRHQGLTGAAVWFDYVTTEADRLTLAYAVGASEHGAILANHLEATSPLVEGRRVVGVRAMDHLSGRTVEIAARLTVNATGAAIDQLLRPLGTSARVPLLKAMNLVTRRPAGGEALGARSASGRYLFLVPSRGRALLGTSESIRVCTPGETAVSEAEVSAVVAELNEAFPRLALTLAEVTMVHRGLVPAAVAGDRASLQGHEQVRDHAPEGFDGLVSVAGTKYTTARAVAERVTTRLLEKLRHAAVTCRTASVPLPGGDIADLPVMIADARREHGAALPSDSIPHLIAAYGSRYRRVLALATDHAEWRLRVVDDSPVIGAQLVWAVREEMALTLVDAVVRRTPLGSLGHPGTVGAERAAQIVGRELGWSAQRTAVELATLDEFYLPIVRQG